MAMRTKNSTLAWISIAIALASTVGIFFIPSFQLWFLLVLIANVVVSLLFRKRYDKPALTVCRLLVGSSTITGGATGRGSR